MSPGAVAPGLIVTLNVGSGTVWRKGGSPCSIGNRRLLALSQVATTLIGLVAFVAILETFLYLVFVKWRQSRLALPIMLATPALIGLLVLAINPALLGVVVVLEVVLYPLFIAWRKPKHWLPMMLVTPAVIFLTILYIYPLLWEFNLSFTKMNLRNFFDPGLLGFTGGAQHLRRPPELHRHPAAGSRSFKTRTSTNSSARRCSGPRSTSSSTSRWASASP